MNLMHLMDHASVKATKRLLMLQIGLRAWFKRANHEYYDKSNLDVMDWCIAAFALNKLKTALTFSNAGHIREKSNKVQ